MGALCTSEACTKNVIAFNIRESDIIRPILLATWKCCESLLPGPQAFWFGTYLKIMRLGEKKIDVMVEFYFQLILKHMKNIFNFEGMMVWSERWWFSHIVIIRYLPCKLMSWWAGVKSYHTIWNSCTITWHHENAINLDSSQSQMW